MAAKEELPIRSHFRAIHAHTDREIHLQCVGHHLAIGEKHQILQTRTDHSIDSILFLTLSMLLLACIVYLPDHISTMSRRAYYYFAGEMALKELSWQAAETLQGTATSAADSIASVASELAHSAQTTAADATTAVQEAVG